MKKKLLSLFLIVFSVNVFSQNQEEILNKVDKIIYSYHSINSIEELVKRVDYDFNTDIEKIRAIYSWIALNIKYEIDNSGLLKLPESYIVFNDYDLKRRLKTDKKKTISNAIKSKKGVCKEYAYLFQKACDLLNIKNQLIYGYTRNSSFQIGLIPNNKNHVWNAVMLNNKWILIDITFGAGYIYKDVWQQKFDTSYFDISKEKLRLTHYPSDTFWFNLIEQRTLNEFCNSPLINGAYIKHDAKIIRPLNGNIKVSKENEIKLQFRNLPITTKVYYKYENDYYLKETNRVSKNSIVNITLPKPRKNDNLKIFFDKELAMEYNVIVEK